MKRIMGIPLNLSLNRPWKVALLYLVIRLATAPLYPIPGAVAIDPLWALIPWMDRKGGRYTAGLLLPVMVAGDVLSLLSGMQILLRAAGFLVLWGCQPQGSQLRQAGYWISSHALWSALGTDFQGLYPLGYIYSVWVLQGILWAGILLPRENLGKLRDLLPALILPGLLILLHLIPGSPPLWPLPQIGISSPRILQIATSLLLLIHPGLTLWKRKPDPPDPSPSRWTDLDDETG